MKTNFKRIGKRTISVILSMMMVFSSLFVGTVTTANASTTARMYLIGNFTSDNWDSNRSEYPISTNYGTSGKFYRTVNVTSGTVYYFALWNGSDRYAPSTQHTVLTSDGGSGNYDNDGNSWKYIAPNNVSKIKICVDQTHDSTYPDRPWVWIEEVSNLSATLTATSTTLASGATTTISTSVTGGSGNYTHSYKVTNSSGTDVTSSTLNGTTFTAPDVTSSTTYTITDTITDTSYSGSTTASVTITVNPSKNANEVTPTFVDGKTTNSVSITKDVATQLDVTAELVGVGDPYTLTYSTVCSDSNITITNANTATPTITSAVNGTYTLTTTVTNNANTNLKATRTTTVTVSDEQKGDIVENNYLLYSNNDSPSNLGGTTVDQNGGYYNLYESLDANGNAIANEYKAYLDINTLKADGNNYFAYSTSTAKGSAEKWSTITVIKTGDYNNELDKGLVKLENKEQDGYRLLFLKFSKSIETDTAKYILTGVTVTINTSTKTYTVEPKYTTETITPVPDDADLTIYAKDGVRDLGITSVEVSKEDGVGFYKYESNDPDYYGVYFVENGKRPTLKITTKMQVNLSTGYYVGGFNINGETYEAIQVRTEKRTVDAAQTEYAVYQTEYVVTGNESNCGKDKILEITPVYFNSKIENAGDYVTLYVDSKSLGAGKYGDGLGHWGNMISCYPYYLTANEEYDLGNYPGQVMLKDNNGKYYTKVPKVHYTKEGERTTNAVTGLTFNSYTEKGKHSDLIEIETYSNSASGESGLKNYQTYDYDDFALIAAMGYDTVQFDIEFREGKTNQATLGGHVNGNVDTDPIDIDTFAGPEYNGWDDLLDYDDKQIDLLGNRLTDDQKNNNSPVYVVSIGNQQTQGGNRNTDIGQVGRWSTVWYVYDSSDNYITQGVPSDFIPRYATDAEGNLIKDPTTGKYVINADDQTKPYKAFSNSEFVGHPVKICYESEMNASTASKENIDGECHKNTGKRLDGRWRYATAAGVELPVTLQVQYTNNLKNDGTTVWTNESATNVSGSKASIDGNETVDGRVEVVYNERNKEAQLNAVAGAGYVFYEWGVVNADGSNYTPLTALKTSNGSLKIDKEFHIVARFVKIEEGSIVLSHNKYLGPDSFGGSGTYYISAKHYASTNKTGSFTDYPMTEGDIVIPLRNSDGNNVTEGVIEVTLTTVCKGQNKFLDWYELAGFDQYQMIGYEDDRFYNKPGTAYYTFDVYVSNLYDYKGSNLIVESLRFFSDIAPVSTEGKLIYNYIDRFGATKQYVKKIQLTSANYNDETQEYEITDEMIANNAPAIDDLTKDCKWEIESSQFAGTVVTLNGTHKDKTHTAIFVDEFYKDGASHTYKEIPTNTLVKVKEVESDGIVTYERVSEDDVDGEFITAKGDNFLYWLVIDNKTGREVAKCFYEQFVLKIVDDYTITAVYGDKLENSVTISAPEFTREQSTDSEGNNVKDYLYADFIIAYMPENGELIRDNPDKYQTGLILEVDKDMKLLEININTIKADREKTENSLWDVNYTLPESYIEDYKFTSVESTIINYAQTLENGAKEAYKTDGNTSNNRLVYNFEVTDNSAYNNFNRATFYIRFNNTTAYQNYVMKAYYYVHELDEDGNITNTTLSEPIYFNFYLIGTSDQIVVERPSTTE